MKIGEISKRMELPTSTLRYYEKEGLLQVARDEGGRRDYDENDIAWIAFIKRLKETGMPLKKIRRYSGLRYQGDATMQERLDMLICHREFVLEERRKWDEHLAVLDKKIALYESNISENTG